jgi:hypothetical protein
MGLSRAGTACGVSGGTGLFAGQQRRCCTPDGNESRRSVYIVSEGPRFLGPSAGRSVKAASSRDARWYAAQAKALPGRSKWV